MNLIVRSLKDALAGLIYCFITQRNMAIHAAFGLLVLLAALLLRVSALEMFILLAAIFLVLVAEAFNTALEKAVDLATRDQNDLAHIAKDVAAGAVLLTAIFAVLTGLIVFGPRLWQLFFTRGS
jgi:diacylglycerol kinase